MPYDPLRFLGGLPQAVLLPLVLLLFSFVTRLFVHTDPFLAFLHSIPPRIALAATGIIVAAGLAPSSYLNVQSGGKPSTVAIVLILSLVCYVACEGIHQSAKKRGAHQWWTVVAGALAYGLITLAARYAQIVP